MTIRNYTSNSDINSSTKKATEGLKNQNLLKNLKQLQKSQNLTFVFFYF